MVGYRSTGLTFFITPEGSSGGISELMAPLGGQNDKYNGNREKNLKRGSCAILLNTSLKIKKRKEEAWSYDVPRAIIWFFQGPLLLHHTLIKLVAHC